ncbi:MAG TPA: DUF542 domain-containing protein [Gemmatimonadales bacterium]|jgi:regulator of cell morphogenesis and NO signaling|nr:DUF542 domain-containing protein [Gemmatimonadales bacterium]
MTTTTQDWDCSNTVHEIITRAPATKAVFQRYGVDTCCGSHVSVEEAARRDNLDSNRLCNELRAAAAGECSVE